MANRYDPAAQMRAIAADLRRTRDTIEKMTGSAQYGADAKLRTAASHLQEAAALVAEAAGTPASTQTFTR